MKAFTIHYSTEVVDFINRMDELVEIRWHTTWQTWANDVGKAIGLNRKFLVADAPEFGMIEYKFNDTLYHGPHGWWKMGAALRVVKDEQRPLIWTDDDLISTNYYHERRVSHKARFLHELNGVMDHEEAILLMPDELYGLQPHELERIETFAEEIDNRTDYEFSED